MDGQVREPARRRSRPHDGGGSSTVEGLLWEASLIDKSCCAPETRLLSLAVLPVNWKRINNLFCWSELDAAGVAGGPDNESFGSAAAAGERQEVVVGGQLIQSLLNDFV